MPDERRTLTNALGWASLGLGTCETLAPGPFLRFLGARDTPRARLVTVGACGLRELGAAGGILALERPPRVRTLQARVAVMACRPGGIVSVIGVYGGFMDKFPAGAFMNKGLTMRTGQCHVQRYMRPLLERIENGDIDPSFVVTHRMELGDAPEGYETFKHKHDECVKVVLKP